MEKSFRVSDFLASVTLDENDDSSAWSLARSAGFMPFPFGSSEIGAQRSESIIKPGVRLGRSSGFGG